MLLDAVTSAGVGSFVFSSSAAVYGAPDVDRVDEGLTCRPVNPCGRTKLIGEQLVQDVAAATGLRYVSLRYFNVAGCARSGLADLAESNLVPMVFRRLAQRRPPVLFGDDYPTPDGTCVRDFVHVADIAAAHVRAASRLTEGSVAGLVANVGRGEGFSVREMVGAIRAVTGTSDQEWAEPVVAPRRPGDPARVVAAADTIARTLGWSARFGLEDMVRSAWAGWRETRPAGTSAAT